MFEVGKRYKRVKNGTYMKDSGLAIKIGEVVIFVRDYGIGLGLFEGGGLAAYTDMEPIGDTPVPRMVTTCDIGARVVRGRDWNYAVCEYQGGENPVGTITHFLSESKMVHVEWDNGYGNSYDIGDEGKYDLYYADEQPKKEAGFATGGIIDSEATGELIVKNPFKSIEIGPVTMGVCDMKELGKLKDDDGTDETPPDPAPGIASVMFGSKPRLMYGSLMQIQGPTKDEQARNARTEEERKRYETD